MLENVSLVVGSREIAVVSGDSGVGKSTLLHLIASLLQPDVGRIRCPERLGLVFQDDRLLPWRSNAWTVPRTLASTMDRISSYSSEKGSRPCFSGSMLRKSVKAR